VEFSAPQMTRGKGSEDDAIRVRGLMVTLVTKPSWSYSAWHEKAGAVSVHGLCPRVPGAPFSVRLPEIERASSRIRHGGVRRGATHARTATSRRPCRKPSDAFAGLSPGALLAALAPLCVTCGSSRAWPVSQNCSAT